MAGLAGILGNPVLEQILAYNVVGQLIGAALSPFMQALTNEVQQAAPLVPLSPADAADAVIRNLLDQDAAAHEASFSGFNAERFGTLVGLAGNAPDPTSMAIALRRKLIDAGTYDRGIRQGRLRDEWATLVQELAVQQPSPADALTASVEGQLDPGEAKTLFVEFGGDATHYDWLLGTVGAGPSPLEAAMMAYRGLIPWGGSGLGVISFDQAVKEGHTRNKWTDAYRGLSVYLPPPRTISAMHRENALTDAEAAKLLEEHGVPPALAGAYLASSTSAKLTKSKNLAESTVLDLYRDRLIPRAEAVALTTKLGYDAAEAEFILEVEDLRVEARAMTAAVSRIGSLFTGHKIDHGTALAALGELGVEVKSAGELVGVWDLERAANVRLPSAAQIEAAFGYDIIDQPTALAELESMGYSPHDAWLVLSVHNKAPLDGEPGGSTLPAPAGP